MKISDIFASKKILPVFIVAGVVALVVAKQSAQPPQQKTAQQDAVAVNLMPLTSQTLQPSVSGYGVVKAAVELNQTAEVGARVMQLNPLLVAGATIKQGTLLVELDAKDYQLARSQATSQQLAVNAQITELNSNQNNLLQRQKLVNDKIQLAQQELKRKTDLAKVQSLSASQLDAEQQKLIGLQQEAASLQQQVEALPAQKQHLQAQLESAIATVDQQQRNIERTGIFMPFDGRIRSVDIEKGEYVKQGQALFQAIGIDQVEIEAQFSLDKLRPFIQLAFSKAAQQNPDSSTTTNGQNLNQLLQQSGLSARISMPLAPGQFWDGEVVTLRETVDPNSHTLGAIIRVNKHYEGVIPGKRPPLLAGLQVKAELLSRASEFISVPLSALHAGKQQQQNQLQQHKRQHWLYLAAPDNGQFRLQKQAISPLLISDNSALFSPQQLQFFADKKHQLVLNDLTPAIENMLLMAADQPENDHAQ